MVATYCLGAFARQISERPRPEWKQLVESQPETCPRDCKAACRAVCAEYARMQWRMAGRREGA